MRPLRPVVLASLLLGACCRGASEVPERTSVILISIDTLRADHVGLYGYERDTTPFLDRWSKDATVFERAYTTAAWTLVAHMTMLTGLFPEQHGVIASKRALNPEIPLVAERLKAAGYTTCALYTPGWIEPRYGFDRGFEVYLPHEGLAEVDRQLESWMDDRPKDEPFFLFLHLFDAHCGPFDEVKSDVYPSPEPYEHMFVTKDMKPWPDVPPKEIWWTRGVLGPEEFRTATAMYDGGIREVDDQLARWFPEFECQGMLANTLVIVTADHGEALGQRGIMDKHGESFQEGLHVPLIVRDPKGRAAGTRVTQPVHLGDLVPTILEATGLPIEKRLPGLPLFDPLPEKRAIYGIKLPEAFILDGDEKLVLGAKDSCVRYDLAKDPRELAPEPVDPGLFKKRRREIMDTSGEFPPFVAIGELTLNEQQKLEALGYAGGDDKEPPPAPTGGK